jgi:hypothetical protein
LKFGGVKRLKSGQDKRSKLGKENWLKSGKEKRSKLGKELAVAAPMTAKAAKDTAIAGARFEATCCAASGCLSACVSLSRASATCVPHGSAQSPDSSPSPVSKNVSRGRFQRRLARDRPPEFGLNHGLIWLTIGYSREDWKRPDLSGMAGLPREQIDIRTGRKTVKLGSNTCGTGANKRFLAGGLDGEDADAAALA